ncbi:response regulator [Pseudaeromonas sp. ZJS20]|uniref:response regulator n=1 Tax=Pseudaeromonas aegiceratis TaxID=3153928 RepID=UPI00390CAC04
MAHSVIICDDSRFARNQLARALPAGFAQELHHAGNGREALALLRARKGELLFLDLNMPDLDGYQVLETIRREDLHCLVIVVSGDIQPQAQQRIMSLGALAFMRKPLATNQLHQLLLQYGLLSELPAPGEPAAASLGNQPVGYLESLQELLNVAMGQAANQMANLLNVFIHLPIPALRLCSRHQVMTEVANWCQSESHCLVSQGFIGSNLAGECLIRLDRNDGDKILRLMGQEEAEGDGHEVLMELATMLSSALLLGLAEQLGFRLSHSHPTMANNLDDSHIPLADDHALPVLSVNFTYTIPSQQLSCDLLLLFTEASLRPLEQRLSLLVE